MGLSDTSWLLLEKAMSNVKSTKGFSYIDILAALALFSITMVVALQLMTATRLNIDKARDCYVSNLAANSIGLSIRDAILNRDPICVQTLADSYGVRSVAVHIFDGSGANAHGSPHHLGSVTSTVSVEGFLEFSRNFWGHLIFVSVGESRSVHFAIDYDDTGSLWRRRPGG